MSGAIWERFVEVAGREGDKLGIIDAATGQNITYQELLAQSKRFAKALEERDEGALAFWGEPSIAALPLVLACAAVGCCFVPLSDSEPAHRVLQTLSYLPGPLLLASANGLPDLPEVEVGAPLDALGLRWQVVGRKSIVYDPLPFLVTHSSGSTGRPKAIAFSQDTKLRRTTQTTELFNLTYADTVLSPTPLHHSLGQRHFFVSIMTGATLVKAYPFSSDLWVKAVQENCVTFAIPVATHLKILQPRLLKDPTILSSFRCIVTSSAPAEPEFKRAILDQADFEFWEIYGMSETACATAIRYTKGDDTSHLGKAIDGTTLRIAGEQPYKCGEIEVLSDCLCDGYWGDPKRWTASRTEDGYFRSGDLGRFDEQGNLTFLGRANESFESGGLVVFPAEIERVIAELPQISDCVAFGMPDPVFGNLVALSYLAVGQISDRDVIKYIRSKMPKYMWPARVFRRDAFPLLSSGKVDRRRLVEILTA
jgi:acyl-CoA synthetase (AMP-forming)/AMP-acid ligase II